MNCKGAEKNSKNALTNFKGERSPPGFSQTKRLLLFAVLFTSLLLAIGTASATFRVRGDFPDTGLNYRVEAYDTAQANMCDGTPDNPGVDVNYFSSVYAAGDSSYDDDDDYDETSGSDLGGATLVYFYLCGPGGNAAAKVVEFTKVVNDGDDLEIDIGYVNGGGNTHNNLTGDYVFVCSAYGGYLLSSVNKQPTDGEGYTQYFYIDKNSVGTDADNPIDTAYVFFDNDTTNPCTWDDSKMAGRAIDLNASTPDNFGVYATYEPDQLSSGDTHMVLRDANIAVYNSSGKNVGLAHVGSFADGDGTLVDYNMYFDNPASGNLTIVLTPDGTPVSTAHKTNVYNVDRTIFSGGDYDFVVDVNEATGISTALNKVRVNMSKDTDAVYYQTVPTTSGATKVYDLFIDNNGTGWDDIQYMIGDVNEFIAKRNLSSETDRPIDVARVYGETDANLESGDDMIEIYSDSNCADANILNSQIEYPTETAGGNDYNQFFDVNGKATFYMKIKMRDGANDYNTCGNAFTLTSQEANQDITVDVTGKVPDGNISVIAVDIDQDGTDDANTVNVHSGVYHVFSVTDATLDENVIFYNGPYANDTVELTRIEDLSTAGTKTVNVAMVSGSTHTILNDGDAEDIITIHSDGACTTLLSSKNENPLTARTPDYNQYYESNGDINYYIKVNARRNATDYVSCIRLAGSGNGAVDNINIDQAIDGNAPVDVHRVGIDWTTANTINDVNSDVVGTGFLAFTPSASAGAEANIRFFDASGKLLLSRQKDLSTGGKQDINVANVGGDAHTVLEQGSSTIAVYSGFDNTTGALSTLVSSETVNPADAGGADYNQYFEYSGIDQNYFLKVTVVKNGVSYDTNGNVFMVDNTHFTGTTFIDHTDMTIDLTVDKDGNVTSDIHNVGIDYNQDGVMEAFAQVHGGQYHLVAQPDADGVDVNFYDSGRNSVFGTKRAALTAGNVKINVSKVSGELPSGFEGDNAYLQFDTNTCTINVYGDFNAVAATLTGTPDYTLYYDANGTDYNVVFCDDDTAVAKTELYVPFTSDSNGSVSRIISAGKVSGEAHAGLEGANGRVRIFSDSSCTAGNEISTHIAPTTDGTNADYNIFFYSHIGAGTYYLQADRASTFATCQSFDLDANGGTMPLNIDVEVEGEVPTGVGKIRTDVNSAFTADISANQYYIYAGKGDASDIVYFEDGGDTVLYRTTQDMSGNVASLDIGRIDGNLHANISTDDNVQVYNDAHCVTLRSSEDVNVDTANSNVYSRYFYSDNAGNIFLKVREGNYRECISVEEGDQKATIKNYDLNFLVYGNLGGDVNVIKLDLAQDGTDEIDANIDETATPNTYKIYFDGKDGNATFDINFYNVGTKRLQLAGKDATSDLNVHVGRVAGEMHANASAGANDAVTVYVTSDCETTLVSSQTVNATAAAGVDYSQYFEGDDTGTYYVQLAKDGKARTCSSGITLSNQENTSVDFNYEITGIIPNRASLATKDINAIKVANYIGRAVQHDYNMYVEGEGLTATETIAFYDDNAATATLLLTRTKDLSSGNTIDVNVAYVSGPTHAILTATDDINVCNMVPARTTTAPGYFGNCDVPGFKVSSEDSTNANDFNVYFEYDGNSTYFLEIVDTNVSTDYNSYHKIKNATKGAILYVPLDGVFNGKVTEEYDTSIGIADANVELRTGADGTDWNAYTFTVSDGNYAAFGNTLAGEQDFRFSKAGYITRDWSTNAGQMKDQQLSATLDTNLPSGVYVTVVDSGGQPITDANVALLSDVTTTPHTVLTGCVKPSGRCQRDSNNYAGGVYTFSGFTLPDDIVIKVSKPGYETVLVPDYNGGTAVYHTVTSSSQWAPTITFTNVAPGAVSLRTPLDNTYESTTTPTLKWFDLNVDEINYKVQVDDDFNFGSMAVNTYTGGGNIVAYTVPAATLANGSTYYWRVRAYDGVSDGDWSDIRSFTIDGTAPAAPTIGINTNEVYVNTVSITVTVTSNGAYYCRLSNDGTSWAGWQDYNGADKNYPWTLTAGDGTKTVYVACKNNAGLEASNSENVVLDTTAPDGVSIAINDGNQFTTSRDITIDVNALNAKTCEYSVDGTTWDTVTDCNTENFNTPNDLPAGDGLKTVWLKATDAVGNFTTASATITLDTTAPDTAPTATATESGNQIVVTWTAGSDATSGVDYYNLYRKTSDGVAKTDTFVAGGLKGQSYVDSPGVSGNFWYALTAVDYAGNESAIGTDYEAAVDFNAPTGTVIVINDGNDYTRSRNVTIDTNASGADICEYSTDGWATVVAITCDSVNTAVTLPDGEGVKTVSFKATDANANVTNAADTIIYDATAPNTEPVATAALLNNTIRLNWTAAADALSGIKEYRVYRNRGAAPTLHSDYMLVGGVTGLVYTDQPTSTGTYYYKIVAVDNSDNNSDGSNTVNQAVDFNAPVGVSITINDGNQYITDRTKATIDVNALGADNCHYSTDGGATETPIACTAADTAITLPAGDGLKTVIFYARDSNNNATTATDTIKLDSTNPANVTGTLAVVSGQQIKVTWNQGTDATSGVDYYKIYRDTTSGFAIAANKYLGETKNVYYWDAPGSGTYYYKVTAVDYAGNEGTTTDQNHAELDKTAPQTSLLSINGGALYTNSVNVTLALFSSDNNAVEHCWASNDGNTWTSIGTVASYAWALSAGNGVKSVFYVCEDYSDNNSALSTKTIMLDATAPSTPVAVWPLAAAVSGETFMWDWNASVDANVPDGNSGVHHYYVQLTRNGTFLQDENVYDTHLTLVGRTPGVYVLTVAGVDNAGNQSGTLTFSNVTVDLTIPSAAPTNPLLNTGERFKWTNSTSVDFNFTATDDTAVSACLITPYKNKVAQTAVAVVPVGGVCGYTLTSLSSGDSAYATIDVNDSVGNWSGSTVNTATYIVDTTAPGVAIISPTSSSILSDTTPTVRFHAWDSYEESDVNTDSFVIDTNGVTRVVTITCDNNAPNSWDCNFDVSPAFADPSTDQNLEVTVYDRAGNSSTATVTDLNFDSSDYITVVDVNAHKSRGTNANTYATGWQWDFNIILGTASGNDKNKIRFKLANFTTSSNYAGLKTLAVDGNARMVYDANVGGAQSTQTYNIQTDYNAQRTVYALWDHNPNTAGIDANFYIQVKIPSPMASGTYRSTYGIRSYSS